MRETTCGANDLSMKSIATDQGRTGSLSSCDNTALSRFDKRNTQRKRDIRWIVAVAKSLLDAAAASTRTFAPLLPFAPRAVQLVHLLRRHSYALTAVAPLQIHIQSFNDKDSRQKIRLTDLIVAARGAVGPGHVLRTTAHLISVVGSAP